MRSLFLNLKDKANPALRLGVISGELSVAKLCKMAPSEMASEQRKEADRLLQEENLFKSYGAKEPEAETTAFVCARCKSVRTLLMFLYVYLWLTGRCACLEQNALSPGADPQCRRTDDSASLSFLIVFAY